MSRNRNSNLSKTLKDYAVPLVWLILILILLYSVFSSWSSTVEPNNSEVSEEFIDVEPKVLLNSDTTEAYIIYENWKKEKIEESILIWKSEKVSVESWSITIDFPFIAKMKLSKNWEFLYKEDWSFFLDSWDLWVEAMKDLEISMKYSTAWLSLWSISNLKQNELESTVYSIDWDVLISNLAWINSNIPNFYRNTIKSTESTSNDLDLKLSEKEIEDHFKLSSWFKDNKWDSYLLQKKLEQNTLSWSLSNSSWTLISDTSTLISFDDIVDESYVNVNPVDLKWRYNSSIVWRVTINNIEVELNNELWIFSLKWFELKNLVNDLVIKIYDSNKNIIWKKILTINTTKPTWWNSNLVNSNSSQLENFQVKPTDFLIYEPTKTWKLTTSSWMITIRWKVSNKTIEKVIVNGYSLKSFNWSTWRYHAFVEQGTLKEGANNYEIKYIWKDWKVVYKEYYSIFKVKAWISNDTKKDEKEVVEKEIETISSEVKIN